MMTFEVDAIKPEHALSVLKTLVNEDAKIAARVQQIITQLICDVDPAQIADEVVETLESIDVEELWDRSGSKRGGYIEPYEMADEMIHEALLPFLDQLKEYTSLTMKNEEALYFMGILRGLYLFDTESNTQFREWAEDIAGEVFNGLITEWENDGTKKDLSNIKKFVEENCQEWFQTTWFE